MVMGRLNMSRRISRTRPAPTHLSRILIDNDCCFFNSFAASPARVDNTVLFQDPRKKARGNKVCAQLEVSEGAEELSVISDNSFGNDDVEDVSTDVSSTVKTTDAQPKEAAPLQTTFERECDALNSEFESASDWSLCFETEAGDPLMKVGNALLPMDDETKKAKLAKELEKKKNPKVNREPLYVTTQKAVLGPLYRPPLKASSVVNAAKPTKTAKSKRSTVKKSKENVINSLQEMDENDDVLVLPAATPAKTLATLFTSVIRTSRPAVNRMSYLCAGGMHSVIRKPRPTNAGLARPSDIHRRSTAIRGSMAPPQLPLPVRLQFDDSTVDLSAEIEDRKEPEPIPLDARSKILTEDSLTSGTQPTSTPDARRVRLSALSPIRRDSRIAAMSPMDHSVAVRRDSQFHPQLHSTPINMQAAADKFSFSARDLATSRFLPNAQSTPIGQDELQKELGLTDDHDDSVFADSDNAPVTTVQSGVMITTVAEKSSQLQHTSNETADADMELAEVPSTVDATPVTSTGHIAQKKSLPPAPVFNLSDDSMEDVDSSVVVETAGSSQTSLSARAAAAASIESKSSNSSPSTTVSSKSHHTSGSKRRSGSSKTADSVTLSSASAASVSPLLASYQSSESTLSKRRRTSITVNSRPNSRPSSRVDVHIVAEDPVEPNASHDDEDVCRIDKSDVTAVISVAEANSTSSLGTSDSTIDNTAGRMSSRIVNLTTDVVSSSSAPSTSTPDGTSTTADATLSPFRTQTEADVMDSTEKEKLDDLGATMEVCGTSEGDEVEDPASHPPASPAPTPAVAAEADSLLLREHDSLADQLRKSLSLSSFDMDSIGGPDNINPNFTNQTDQPMGDTMMTLPVQADGTYRQESTLMVGGNATGLSNMTEDYGGRNTAMTNRLMTTIRHESMLIDGEAVPTPFYLLGYEDHGSGLEQLLHVIEQKRVWSWDELPKDVMKKPRKLGEGVYGEVFGTQYNGAPTAMKIIPFHGDVPVYNGLVNGENMWEAVELIPEILSTRELAALHDPLADHSTPNFIGLLKCHVVKGHYTEPLLEAWDEFDQRKESENDRPSEYTSPQQLHLVIGLAMGGVDLESYQMKNEHQVLSVLLQTALSLVIAETVLEFEHRDLHIGNILALETTEDVHYRLHGNDVTIKSHGVKINIIDFTLSRLYKSGTTIFRDLEGDEEMFTGTGNYQFEIYRLMRKNNSGDWANFERKSNVFWLHYLARELIENRKAKKAITKKRQKELMSLFNKLLNMASLEEMFTNPEFTDIITKYLDFKAAGDE